MAKLGRSGRIACLIVAIGAIRIWGWQTPYEVTGGTDPLRSPDRQSLHDPKATADGETTRVFTVSDVPITTPAGGFVDPNVQAGTSSFDSISNLAIGPDFGLIRLDTPFSSAMLDFQNQQTEKQRWLIENGATQPVPSLIPAMQLRGSLLAGTTNVDNKFSYLGRFPPDFVGGSVTDARLVHGNLAIAGHFTPAFHGYVETLYSDVFSFPTFNQGSFQVRQAYLAVGNLEGSPWYLFLGKKTVSFGDMRTLNPFSQSTVWHYFAGLAEGVGGGYSRDGLNFTATALNGGRGIRVVDSPSKGELNNFAVNGSIQRQWGNDLTATIGAGYLDGTIYDAAVAEHVNPNLFGKRNPAWDVNATFQVRQWLFSGEYVETLEPWPTTGVPVQAFRTELACDSAWGLVPVRYSAGWSEGIQGPSGSEFEFNRQFVLGAAWRFSPSVLVTAEYVHSAGFAPLIDITTVSDRNVHQHSAVVGCVLVL